jgi:nitrate reductase NapE
MDRNISPPEDTQIGDRPSLWSREGRRELLMFLALAVLIWPFIAVGVVAGWGFVVWMYYMFTGPPGPV